MSKNLNVTASYYDRMTRSQIIARIAAADTALLNLPTLTPKYKAAKRERAELFAALARKDEELLDQWERRSKPFAQP